MRLKLEITPSLSDFQVHAINHNVVMSCFLQLSFSVSVYLLSKSVLCIPRVHLFMGENHVFHKIKDTVRNW